MEEEVWLLIREKEILMIKTVNQILDLKEQNEKFVHFA
jgi:hypothetical protein